MSTAMAAARVSCPGYAGVVAPAVGCRRRGWRPPRRAVRTAFARIGPLPRAPAGDDRPLPRILAQSAAGAVLRAVHAPTPGQWLAVGILGLSGVAAFGLAPGTAPEAAPTRTVRFELPRPAIAAIDESDAGYWREDRIRRGDTIGSVLARLGVSDPAALEFLRTDPSARAVYQLRPGRPLTVETDDDGRLLHAPVRRPAAAIAFRSRATASASRRRPRPRRWRSAGRWPPARSARRCSARPTRPASRTP